MIKKRPGWHMWSKPFAPVAPVKPEKQIVDCQYTTISTIGQWESRKLGDLALPDGVKLEDVIVSADVSYDSESNTSDVTVSFDIVNETTIVNTNYERQLKKYEEYKLAKAEHKKELKEWKAWVEQEKVLDLEKQIKHAEDLLKKHGKLPS